MKTILNFLSVFRILSITNKCTGSLQFSVNDYLALLVAFSMRRVRHLKQIGLLYDRVLLLA